MKPNGSNIIETHVPSVNASIFTFALRSEIEIRRIDRRPPSGSATLKPKTWIVYLLIQKTKRDRKVFKVTRNTPFRFVLFPVIHCKKKVQLYTKNGGSSVATNIGVTFTLYMRCDITLH